MRVFAIVLLACVAISAGRMEEEAVSKVSWKNTPYNFQIPVYFSDGTDYFYGDGPYSMVIFKHQNAVISYCSLLGAWACDDGDFPGAGSVIAEGVSIKNITYKSKKGIFSGYTTDGRIYYMKKKLQNDQIGDDGATYVCHPSYLAVIYPKSRQAEMDAVIKMISKW